MTFGHGAVVSPRRSPPPVAMKVFTEDADYIEHAFGVFKGRDRIRDWITKVMAPFPHMTVPQDWVRMFIARFLP